MTARKHTPAHDFWHPRVEGQIRHTMGRHPEWFAGIPADQKTHFVNSLAKRIVGEIVAGLVLATMPGRDGPLTVLAPAARGGDSKLPPHVRGVCQIRSPDDEPQAEGVERV